MSYNQKNRKDKIMSQTEPNRANANTVDPATHLNDAQIMGR